MTYRRLDKKPLGFFPTPLVELPRLSERLGGPRLLMKRDDQTGLALGGNKTRKLEYLMADALSGNADVIVTAGAAQSNHCRQTAAAAAYCGLKCHLLLGGNEPAASMGNHLLDQLLGAEIHFTGEARKGETIPGLVKKLKEEGYNPYVIPYGGSNEIGAAAFVEALLELQLQLSEQKLEIDRIVFASSSGGTHAGFLVGRHLLDWEIDLVGIEIDKSASAEGRFSERIVGLANRTAALLEIDATFTGDDIALQSDYHGEGYGVVGPLERRAIELTARMEGILLDPVYTGRAMGGLIDLVERGAFTPDKTILFWHTGGAPALFAHADDLLS